jgi:hypothetical protein
VGKNLEDCSLALLVPNLTTGILTKTLEHGLSGEDSYTLKLSLIGVSGLFYDCEE